AGDSSVEESRDPTAASYPSPEIPFQGTLWNYTAVFAACGFASMPPMTCTSCASPQPRPARGGSPLALTMIPDALQRCSPRPRGAAPCARSREGFSDGEQASQRNKDA